MTNNYKEKKPDKISLRKNIYFLNTINYYSNCFNDNCTFIQGIWLMYWITFSMFTSVETITDIFIGPW